MSSVSLEQVHCASNVIVKDLNAEHALRAQSYALSNLYLHIVATMIPWNSNYKFCEAMFSSEDVKSEYVVPAALKNHT